MRVEIGDGRESVEERLAVVTSTTLKQLRESSDVVESPRGHSVGIGTSPTCEQGASIGGSHGNLVCDYQCLLELGGDANELVNGLFHVFDLGKEVLGVAHLKTECVSRQVPSNYCK